MARGKAEDAGGLTPAKDDNAAPCHFAPRTLPIFECDDYIFFWMVFRAFFSRRLTWAWEMPTSAETSIWVLPS